MTRKFLCIVSVALSSLAFVPLASAQNHHATRTRTTHVAAPVAHRGARVAAPRAHMPAAPAAPATR